jgi:hypothetical protein
MRLRLLALEAKNGPTVLTSDMDESEALVKSLTGVGKCKFPEIFLS